MIEAEAERSAPPGARTTYALLRAAAEFHGDATALVAPGGACVSYGMLFERVGRLAGRLRRAGVVASDRISIVLPNGVEMAIAVLAAMCAGTACPLNPAYRRSELEFYFGDLQARALITSAEADTPAARLAQARGMQIIDPSTCGRVTAAWDTSVSSEDVALVLHTSGTTSRPKMVPLTHANVCRSASSIANWLALSPADRCLNVMPLFHIHGLAGALLASLAAGASVICTEGFVSTEFFAQLREHRATWYSAVPTMHQAILARAEYDGPPPALRFVRSSSAPLPPAVAHALERLYGAPVIEAYGMTEAAHQMCSNPLPPKAQRYGSVGLPAGCDVSVLDERGKPLTCGNVGEVAIRGENVMRGYELDPQANSVAFTHGWFRTGDLGRFDADGYLYLAGRIKDIINRGGEKISPREIDEVLLEHPAVAQAVAFAMPDARLGEEVAAAVVLYPHARVDESGLKRFVEQRLADFKVPRRIAFVDAIPMGPTGKLQRNGLAGKLGFERPAPPESIPEETRAQAREFALALERIWCDVLKVSNVGSADDFFALGGDSLLAARVIARVRIHCGRDLSITAFFDRSTLHEMALAVAAAPRAALASHERSA